MKKVIVMMVLCGVLLQAQQITHRTIGKFVNGECADFCFFSFDTEHGEHTFCVTEKRYPKVSVDRKYTITWKKGQMKVQDSDSVKCDEIINVKEVR